MLNIESILDNINVLMKRNNDINQLLERINIQIAANIQNQKPLSKQKSQPTIINPPKRPISQRSDPESCDRVQGRNLDWVNDFILKDYTINGNKICVKNFTTSWNDGYAVCAIADKLMKSNGDIFKECQSLQSLDRINKSIGILENAKFDPLITTEDFAQEKLSMNTFVGQMLQYYMNVFPHRGGSK